MKLKDVILFFKNYFSDEKKMAVKAFFLLLLTSLFGMLYGFLIGTAIDKTRINEFNLAIILLLVLALLNILDSLIFAKYSEIYMEKCANNMMEKIGISIYEKVGMLPSKAFEEKSSGEFINRIINDSSTITGSFRGILNIIVSLFTSLVVFIYICFNSFVVAIEIIIYLVVFYFVSHKFLPIVKENQKEINKEKDIAVANISESVRGIREIRALGIRKSMNDHFEKLVKNVYAKINKQMLVEKNYYALVNVINISLELVVFITCILLIMNEKVSFAFFMAMTYYIYKFMNTIELMSSLSTNYQKIKVSMERISEILDNKLYKDETFGDVSKSNIEGNIEFRNVTFKYPNEHKEIFKDFNIKIPTNKKVAIVGKSGQGKSTIFNLLLRYFDIDDGAILIDNIPIQNFTENTLRKNIAIIRQDPFIFNKTLIENLQMVDRDASLEKIRNVCKLAEIDDYIMNLPKKYDTMIGEGGINLSGGQKQRLAIARALLKNSKIILFDEATSALDNENQAKIKKIIDKLVENHTIVIVAHRLSTIIDADIIYIIDNGKVVDKGTHSKLLKENPLYRNLYVNEK